MTGTLVSGDLSASNIQTIGTISANGAITGGSVTANNGLTVGTGSSGIFTGSVSIGTGSAPLDRLDIGGGFLRLTLLGSAGAQAVCRNASNQLSTCSSSLRYKTNIGQFSAGMSFVNKLRPISFDWKEGGMKDVGFGAEDIAKIDPRFVTYNDKGEVEGVKYDRLSVAFVNAFNEQQAQIERQQTLIDKQQTMIKQLEKRLEKLEKK